MSQFAFFYSIPARGLPVRQTVFVMSTEIKRHLILSYTISLPTKCQSVSGFLKLHALPTLAVILESGGKSEEKSGLCRVAKSEEK